MSPVRKIQETHGIIGRDHELTMALAVLKAGGHLLLEGPVGVGKTTVALAVCEHLGRKTVRIDGDERYTENKLTGWFDPPLVLKHGYTDDAFFPGPLAQAMQNGSVLFINELNRMPESVQNVLLPALDEKFIILPRIGVIKAAPGFVVVATQNPVEYIATSHISEALRDRFEHVTVAHQNEEEENRIVTQATGSKKPALIAEAVALTRLTRNHPAFRRGASVRAAISMVRIAEHLEGDDVLMRAAEAALTTRVELADTEEGDLSTLIRRLGDELKKKNLSQPMTN